MNEHIITIDYKMWNGDITHQPFPPMPHIGIEEALCAQLVDGQWKITNSNPGASPHWIGRGPNKQQAILNYLLARLGYWEQAARQQCL